MLPLDRDSVAFTHTRTSFSSDMIQQALEVCNSMIERLVPFILEKRSKKSYIGIAISIVILQQIYSYNHVPKKLRGFPKVSFFSMLKALLTNESVSDRTKRLVTPLTNKGHKFYLVSSNSFYEAFVYANTQLV
jgi:hypothetical protein